MEEGFLMVLQKDLLIALRTHFSSLKHLGKFMEEAEALL